MKRILMVAFHFPPLAGSSGIQRTLRFVQHLPSFGWEPLVLSATPRAYERTSDDLLPDVPPGTVVRRALALDASRHLALAGRYLAATARPDRWASWRFDAVRAGLQMIRQFKPQVIWSTYPIATAHVIGAELQRQTGLPWIADFRDPMAQDDYPTDPVTWRAFERIEQRVMKQARMSLFTTPSAVRMYRERYPASAPGIQLLENGYDEQTFAQSARVNPSKPAGGPRVLLHSGLIYPAERDPSMLMAALRLLHDQGSIRPGEVVVRFRAPHEVALVQSLAEHHGVTAYTEVCPPVPYAAALQEMLQADGLLILQAASCNAQVPAKLYEYLRAGRPILCLTDPQGDTAAVLRGAGIARTARLDSAQEIAALLRNHLEGNSPALLPDSGSVRSASRLGRAEQLAHWLDAL